uniref:TATA box binding protein (TBP)-associated factor, RNA polymerase I, C, 110kDa n=2 Tax=Nothobranchius pienaari TaxID=704102 RepID=A0A1A8LNY3_9TELE
MDYQFPQQLFPSFYSCGPPDLSHRYCAEAGGWGSYHGVLPQGRGPLSSWTFTPKHQVSSETWTQTEPVVVPLLPPRRAFPRNGTPPDPLDFTEHMQNFYMDHGQDAFGCMGDILGEHFYFRYKRNSKEKYWRGSISMWKVQRFVNMMNHLKCLQTYQSSSLNSYCCLMSDVIHEVPPDLLGSLLYEELTEQRDRMLFPEGATGGALSFVPFSHDRGCLLYPGGLGQNHLNFHKVTLQHHGLDLSRDAVSFQLKAPIRQISSSSLFSDCCVAVRSDRLCGVWRFSETNNPRLLQVVRTKEVLTCVSASPHILGEVLVASESGAANLWTVGKGLQKVYAEDTNLYFNAKSSWRWCEFSAHPRVMLYADRTGAELTDMRGNLTSGHTLFRISSSLECRSGERLLLSRYLGDVHPFHHLITTQYSAYIMDERFPCMPMLKWDHMMKAPPIFCHVVPPSAASDSGKDKTTKVLLGSHRSQEIMMLQYSGGRVDPCYSRGSVQALLQPKESLKHFLDQVPHRLDIATKRLSAPATGLTCIQREARGGGHSQESLCVLQLTEDGDIFYQVLEHKLQTRNTSGALALGDEHRPDVRNLPASRGGTPESRPADSCVVISETWSDEDVIGPTQTEAVPESQGSGSDSSCEESGGRDQTLKLMKLQVVVNDEQDAVSPSGNDAEERADEEVRRSSRNADATPVTLSSRTLLTWKLWLQKLMLKSKDKHSGGPRADYFRTQTKSLLKLPKKDPRKATEKEKEKVSRMKMRSCMSSRSLLLHSSTSIKPPDVVPLPGVVHPDEWIDQLSSRLTVSWEGEEAWRAWWQDHLGMNRVTKAEALRSRRRREKEARRAAGRCLELSSSFTSSISYQSDLDDFSISAGWSSAASQAEWTDVDEGGALSQLETFLRNETTSMPSTLDGSRPPTPIATPECFIGDNNDPQTPKRPRPLPPTQTGSPEATPTSKRRTNRPARDYLDSLFGTQDDPFSLDDIPLSNAVNPSSQFPGSQSIPRRTAGSIRATNLFGSLASSQTSQAGRGLSQGSEPKKKRSRMGF